MTYSVLAFVMPNLLEILLILVVLGVLIDLTVTLAKYFLHSNMERKRLRLEVGKLADELEQVRKQKGAEQNISLNKSTRR
jgi:uncharacterized membrane protein (DUF106 family)